jgi:hypothetical protein
MMNRIALSQIKANKSKERKKRTEKQINPPLNLISPNKIPASFACI